MEQKKTRYQRLQVRNIWLRAIIELVCIVAAIVLCCTMIVKSYEKSYADAMRESTQENAMQLAHSISSVADRDSLEVEDAQRSRYIAQRYEDILNSCFLEEDVRYSGAVYTVSGSDCVLFAASDGYHSTLSENDLVSKDGKSAKVLDEALRMAAEGEDVSENAEDVYFALKPVSTIDGADPYAVVVTSVEYRDSLEYPSVVKNRITLITVICGLMIFAYYLVSAAISERKKRKGEAVTGV